MATLPDRHSLPTQILVVRTARKWRFASISYQNRRIWETCQDVQDRKNPNSCFHSIHKISLHRWNAFWGVPTLSLARHHASVSLCHHAWCLWWLWRSGGRDGCCAGCGSTCRVADTAPGHVPRDMKTNYQSLKHWNWAKCEIRQRSCCTYDIKAFTRKWFSCKITWCETPYFFSLA